MFLYILPGSYWGVGNVIIKETKENNTMANTYWAPNCQAHLWELHPPNSLTKFWRKGRNNQEMRNKDRFYEQIQKMTLGIYKKKSLSFLWIRIYISHVYMNSYFLEQNHWYSALLEHQRLHITLMLFLM